MNKHIGKDRETKAALSFLWGFNLCGHFSSLGISLHHLHLPLVSGALPPGLHHFHHHLTLHLGTDQGAAPSLRSRRKTELLNHRLVNTLSIITVHTNHIWHRCYGTTATCLALAAPWPGGGGFRLRLMSPHCPEVNEKHKWTDWQIQKKFCRSQTLPTCSQFLLYKNSTSTIIQCFYI